jgi:hypothetical protein
VDELILRPAAPDLRLIDRLRDVIDSAPGRAARDPEE